MSNGKRVFRESAMEEGYFKKSPCPWKHDCHPIGGASTFPEFGCHVFDSHSLQTSFTHNFLSGTLIGEL